MFIIQDSQMENVKRFAGVFAASFIPSNLTFGPYHGPLDITLKTNDHKDLHYILEVSNLTVPPSPLHPEAGRFGYLKVQLFYS